MVATLTLTSWYGLAGSALWICGLAVLLATLSMVHFEVRAAGGRLRDRLGDRRPQMAIAAGQILFCAGLLLISEPWWEKGIWAACGVLGIVWLVRLWRRLDADAGDGT